MQIKASQAASLIATYIQSGIVPLLIGSPGCGKSQIVHQTAKEHNLKVIDMRLSQSDPTDLLGFPQIQDGKAGYVPMDTFPIVGDALPLDAKGEPMNGWLIFLDEFTSAPTAVQAASYKLVLDRMVGLFHLHKNVAIVCAGNKDTDQAIVESMSTAMQSRLAHLELEVDNNEWDDWAFGAGIDHRICDFIKFKPGLLYNFKPDHTDATYAAPRTWEFTDRILKKVKIDDRNIIPLLAGVITEGVAREFVTFCRIYGSLPSIASIIAEPLLVPVPTEPGTLFAMTGSISHNAKDENITDLMKYVVRMPIEFQVVCLRETIKRKQSLLTCPAVKEWVSSNARQLF